jgi:4-hydroxy-tetrahydrodipicolinate reductase
MGEKLIVVGVGSTGTAVVRLALKKGMEIVGAFSRRQHLGEDIGELVGMGKVGVSISSELGNISNTHADVAVYTTVSTLENLYPQILPAIKAGINVISTADELGFPWIYPKAKEIDEAAKKYNVTVFGTGANPGFLTDVVPIVLTSGCQKVTKITVKRVTDFSPYGGIVAEQFGIGLSKEDWNEARKEGKVLGQFILPGLIKYIADCIGLELDEVKEEFEAVIARVPRVGQYCKVEKGNVAGISQFAYGIKKGQKIIILEMNATIQPEAEKVETGNFWAIEGEPSIFAAAKILPVNKESLLVTSARVINSIPGVIKAKPGLMTQKDLPLGGCIMRCESAA